MPSANIDTPTIRTAIELYLDDRQDDAAAATIAGHRSRLKQFAELCEERQLEMLDDITPEHLLAIKAERRGAVGSVDTLRGFVSTVRVFIRFCERLSYVPERTHEIIQTPAKPRNARSVMVERDVAEAIISHHRKFNYAAVEHVLSLLWWRSGLRLGSVRALDVDDYFPRGSVDPDDASSELGPHLRVRHRPESDTPLKNKKDGHRNIAISPEMIQVLDDYIEHRRPDVKDDYGRNPLIALETGRPATRTFARFSYGLTRPCSYGDECPHDRDPNECEEAQGRYGDGPYKCESEIGPHAWRRGAITHWRRQEVPPHIVSDRMNVSEAVLREHYDQRSIGQQMEERRGYLDNI